MTTPTLSDQLRAIVDAIDTPTFAEIRTYHAPRRGRSPRVRFVVALAAVLLLLAIGAGVVALLQHDSTDAGRALRSDPPPECVAASNADPGCDMTPAEASRYLGFGPADVSGLPEGWVPLASRLRLYQTPLPGNVDAPADTSTVALYVRIWGPAGTDLGAADDCTPLVVVRERVALPGEDPSRSGAPFPLGDGTTAYGEAPDIGCYHGELAWVRDGRSTVVAGTNMTLDQLVAVARSLDHLPKASATVSPKCIITLTNYAGCEMTAKRAQRYLGFRPRVPANIPAGWVEQPSRLKIYRSQFDAASLPPGVTEVAEFFQFWAPRGTPPIADRPANFTCTPVLVVRQRMALVGEDTLRTDAGTVDLGSGRVVNGMLEPTACLPGDPAAPSGDLFWSDQGRHYGVTGNGIPNEQFLTIARSLDR